MVHSFEYLKTATGCSLLFMEDGKQRRILFVKNTPAYIHFQSILAGENIVADSQWKSAINELRDSGYRFKRNSNNWSIFRPVAVEPTAQN